MKYVLVTGGVVSGLGKGVTASSIGVVLKACGLRVTTIKIGSHSFPSRLPTRSSLPGDFFFLLGGVALAFPRENEKKKNCFRRRIRKKGRIFRWKGRPVCVISFCRLFAAQSPEPGAQDRTRPFCRFGCATSAVWGKGGRGSIFRITQSCLAVWAGRAMAAWQPLV